MWPVSRFGRLVATALPLVGLFWVWFFWSADVKGNIIVVSLASSVFLGLCGYVASERFWQPLLINLATTCFAVAIGVVAVNLYLDAAGKRDAVGVLLNVAGSALSNFRRDVDALLLSKYSQKEANEIIDEYVRSDMRVDSLTPEQRSTIYRIAKSSAPMLVPRIRDLDDALLDIREAVGWDLDSAILADSLRARKAIRRFRDFNFDDSENAKRNAVELFLDMRMYSDWVLNRLDANQ